jgi:hypothetical protein
MVGKRLLAAQCAQAIDGISTRRAATARWIGLSNRVMGSDPKVTDYILRGAG